MWDYKGMCTLFQSHKYHMLNHKILFNYFFYYNLQIWKINSVWNTVHVWNICPHSLLGNVLVKLRKHDTPMLTKDFCTTMNDLGDFWFLY